MNKNFAELISDIVLARTPFLKKNVEKKILEIESYYTSKVSSLIESLIGGEQIKILDDTSENKIILYYSNDDTYLRRLSEFYGSDKGSSKLFENPYPWIPHNYTDYYSMLFLQNKEKVKKVFECGIGTNNESVESNMTVSGKPGASLRMWRDFFPNAEVYGVDIDRSVLFSEERIHTDYLDQTDSDSILGYWQKLDISDFDLMIDDGLHNFEAVTNLFLNSFDKLSDDGIYIIEDVSSNDLVKYKKFFDSVGARAKFIILFRKHKEIGDNILITITKN